MMFFFFKQKTAYEMRISDWSSDVCSSDLPSSAETAAAPASVVSDEQLAASVLQSSQQQKTIEQLQALLQSQDEEIADQRKQISELQTQQIGRASCRERACQYV